MSKRIFIGGAWPYANNSLHVGHLAALLPGDVIARYHRLAGNEVIYVSGTDSHGTPITERAKKEGCSPKDIAEMYHNEFTKNFADMKFTYDKYTATFTEYHKEHVQEMVKRIYDNGYLYDKVEEQDYCETCDHFLSDREIEGICPICGAPAKGDQCDACLASIEPGELKDKHCRTCGNPTSQRENKHLMFALSKFQKAIEAYFEQNKGDWRWNAVNETTKYLEQGLPDRAATRDLTWGIDVPVPGYEDKKIYVWFEAVMGYLTTGRFVAEERGISFDDYMKADNLESYYVHGKDNIPFHTVIFPALISALDQGFQLPKHIVSSEYMNMNDEKMSKSKGNLVSISDLAERFPADTARFYICLNSPERRDVNFATDDMIAAHNKFLVGGFGNFVNRNLSFLKKKFDGAVPNGKVDSVVVAETEKAYREIGDMLARGEIRNATEAMVGYIQFANKYYDDMKPWVQVKEDMEAFQNTTASCIYMMTNMATLFQPVLPEGTEKLKQMLSLGESKWEPTAEPKDLKLETVEIMYNRIDTEEV